MSNILVVFFSSECQKWWEHVHNLLSKFILNVTLKVLWLKYKVWKLIKNYTNSNYTKVTWVNTLKPILNLLACMLNMKHIWISLWDWTSWEKCCLNFHCCAESSLWVVQFHCFSCHFLDFFFFSLENHNLWSFFTRWLIVTFSCSQKQKRTILFLGSV